MDFSALETAIFLAKITDDPLYKSAIRTISDPESPQKSLDAATKFIESGWKAYLTLFGNSDKHVEHEPKHPFDRPD